MAINLNIEKYGAQFNAFAEFAAAHKNQDWVVRIEGQGRRPGGQGLLGPNGEIRHIVPKTLDGAGNILRFAGSRAVNNDVRSLFKETVLAVCGVRTMEELPPSVLAVMKKDDYDGKGHPLTVRRIKAVTSAIKAIADEEPKSSVVDGTATLPESQGPAIAEKTNVEEQGPQIEVEDAVDPSVDDVAKPSIDGKEISFKYEKPAYIASLPQETADRFMAFYCDAIDRSIAEGQIKEDCDETFKEMFRAVGYDKNDRNMLAELLANGKPRFLDNDNAIPFKERAVKFAESLKAILDKAKECRAKLPKAYGDIVADTLLGVLKTSDEMFDADDLRKIDADMCEKISKVAEEIDTEDLLSVPEDRYRSAKSLSKKLDAFHQASSSKFAAELLSPGDSQLVVAVKQRLLMCMALARDGSDVEEFADEIEERYDDLAGRYGMKSLLDELAPALRSPSE